MRRPVQWRWLRCLPLLLLLLTPAANASARTVAASPNAQSSTVTLVNADEDFIERDGDGGFTARPVLNVQPEILAYGVKDPVDGAWLTALYRVQDDGRSVDGGWEYVIDYPEYSTQADLDPDRAYTLVLMAQQDGLHTFESTIPIFEPTSLWDRVLNAFNPAVWARATAGWVVEGVHGLMCSVLERITGVDLEDCGS